ncbi:hypothetical protein GSF22_24645, partial [Micromonospora echinofusca]|nr:hypothetical protein [Micromonospora echinofusca]
MTGRRDSRETEPTLRPVRWPTWPRRATVLRGALVAVLLLLAAGALYSRGTPSCDPASTGTGPT